MTAPWQYADAAHRTVSRAIDGGGWEAVPTESIADWVAEGNTPLPMPFDTAAAMGRLRTKRDAILDVADKAQLTVLSKGPETDGAVLEDCKQQLRDLPASTTVLAMLADPAMTDAAFNRAVLMLYRGIVLQAPAAAQAAFMKAATA